MKIGQRIYTIYGWVAVVGQRYSPLGNKTVWFGLDSAGNEVEITNDIIREAPVEKAQQEDVVGDLSYKMLARAIGVKRGQKGEKGDRGPMGMTGPEGKKGEKGDKGESGKDGVDGKDGKEGKRGLKGEKGDKGEPGKDGKNGKDGKDGKDGLPGRDGLNGLSGGGIKKIDDASDVKITSPTNGQALKYDSATKKWVNGTIAGGSGDVATDVIWDAKGDLAVGTGADTAARLVVGANGTVLTADSAEATGVKWSTPAGGGDVVKVGTPANNQLAVWTGDGTLEGTGDVTFDGTSLNIATAKNLQIAGSTVLADAAGTTTLSNIDALDATTEATVENAIDTLANLTSIQGRTVTLADAGADALLGWDDSASAYQNLSAADAKTALSLAKGDVGLGNVDNTSDANKPVSSATQTALDLKAPIASPTFTGTVTVPVGLTGVLRADTGVVSVDSDVTDIVAAGTSTAQGKLELATDAETVTGTDTARATTPANLVAKMAAPGTIGNTTPSTGKFTSVETTGTIELGHASDTTLSRSAAGTLAVEGVRVQTTSPLVVSAASYTTDTGSSLNMDNLDMFVITAQAGALLFNAPGGTLVQGRRLMIRIKDNGTARALTWNAVFRAMGTALPSTTVLSKTLYLGFIYNSTDTKWDLVASAQEA